ncbi:hypothetical protein DICVIV_01345 [Dictyocaulus viviparus]|uniref:Uncharacterized protein n=1 Tax=Dictyocaulus viviparus TaxID=29172 RepID=A0A0D8Y928_DICVI|nr:hypothetical protein DICVIV_01345 [Dictyocaulus viviparus]
MTLVTNSDLTDVFYLYPSIEEAIANERQLKDRGLKFVRFETQSMFFDVPAEMLWDSEVISKSFIHTSALVALAEDLISFPVLNQQPIKVPFKAEELEKFLFALAFINNQRDFGAFASSTLCTIMKASNFERYFHFFSAEICEICNPFIRLADYFDCPTVMQTVISQINKRLTGKSPQEICDTFLIRSDVTQSQKHKIPQITDLRVLADWI